MVERHNRRDFARWLIGEKGTLHAAGETIACTVIDVSASGMLLQANTRLDGGTTVIVMLTGLLPFRARVIRAGARDLAIRFADGPQYVFR